MLLSLPSPSVLCIKELNETFSELLWCGKPPKWRKEILEGEYHEGGLTLHNIFLFDKTLKLSSLRRYIKSSGKWTVITNDFELFDIFKFGPDYLDRIIELTSNPFWKDVIKSLYIFWQSDAPYHNHLIKFTPIWLNPYVDIPIKQEWIVKGISTIADFLGTMNVPLTMLEFTTKYHVKTNFLEYHSLISKIRKYIEWRDLPLHEEEQPVNSALNAILNLSMKGSSKLYTLLKGSSVHILDIASDRWSEKTDLNFISFSL